VIFFRIDSFRNPKKTKLLYKQFINISIKRGVRLDNSKKFILWFSELGIKDVPLVGGKNASLGEMYKNLIKKSVSVPNGFAVTAYAYRYLLIKSNIKNQIKDILSDLDTGNMKNLAERGHKVRAIIRNAEFPKELKEAITNAYKRLCSQYKSNNVDVAVRSSATAEDLPDASFAGQQETYLNIKGEHDLIDSCKKCFASLFTNRAISYRVDKKFDHFSIALSIGVQKMVRSDLSCSGVMFSIDTETGFKDVVLINGAYGLGENVVQGAVNPDEFYIFKPTLRTGFKPIVSKTLGSKKIKMIYSEEGSKTTTKNIDTSEEDRNKFVLGEKDILKLAEWACIIEDHYQKPMDMEWAKDGFTKKLFIVQARPETVQSQKNRNILEKYKIEKKGSVIVKGRSVGDRIGCGKANIIKDAQQIDKFQKGEVLVTDITDPDWEPIMKISSAIVTNRGGRTCHSAIISRELGIPCIVGTNDGTQKIKQGQDITVSCAEGEAGFVYKGKIPFKVIKTDLKKIPRPKTKVMMNVGNPEQAFEFSFTPNDGVGLAREEFIINEYIKIHPKALVNYSKIKDKSVKEKIDSLTNGYKNKTEFFIDKLAQGASTIAAAFYPKPVILRCSDFKSNEYANLIGGKEYEPKEDNPMIGWRGASRYYTNYKDCFALECKAIKKVREEMGLTNLIIMIPFCRTVEEGKNVLKEMKKNGLERGKKGLKVFVMCEIPSNVILADEFSKIFDGFSIGTNDLTQLTLGLDRDSELVSHVYDERNLAVKKLVALVIHKAKKNGKKIGLCGDGPSTYPEFAQFLVRCGIDSISLSPDAVIKTTLTILEEEKKLRKRK
jgi:pyruvate,water dikinase